MAETKEKEKNLKDIEKETDKFQCVIQKGIYFIDEFLDGPMCARCLPCPMGSYEMKVRLERLASGNGTEGDLDVISKIAPDMFDSSMCKKGKDTAKFISDTLEKSSDIYKSHAEGCCSDRECKSLVVYRVIEEKCVMCGDCKPVCKDYAILGEKKVPYLIGYMPFEIVEMRCTKCGECLKACQYGAIEIVDLRVKEPAAA